MEISYILNESRDNLSPWNMPSLPQLVRISTCEESEASKHVNTSGSQSDTLRFQSSLRLSEAEYREEEPPLSGSGHGSYSAARNNRRLRFIRMIEEEQEEESRLQERLTWLMRRVGVQKASQALREQLKDAVPIIHGSAKDTVVLERPSSRRDTRSGTPLSEEQRLSRRNMQKRESKRRLFRYYQNQLDAIRENMRRIREATIICEFLFDELIEKTFAKYKQQRNDSKSAAQGPSSLTTNSGQDGASGGVAEQ
ncbi:hypothetical protein GAYE_SCF06G2710 [Galdieria yellowstonensis]|uniref:BZIP domain-containing protein n=1 Tax=Galdieria yellowstonensis TaxID=3028027 RepID=A0AAV9IBW0_9RHOD|nr:hypothetical protein GAYE_SCF06G2710 [Galdieria yellowstonensis]